MKKENSYGIVPLRLHKGHWQVLLVQHHAGHWAFPKGHADNGELPQETAERELQEETGLTVQSYLSPDPLIESYMFTSRGQHISKTVQYFIALVKGEVSIQEHEIKASQWLSVPDAYTSITFKEGKHICIQVSEFLKTLDEHGKPLWASDQH